MGFPELPSPLPVAGRAPAAPRAWPPPPPPCGAPAYPGMGPGPAAVARSLDLARLGPPVSRPGLPGAASRVGPRVSLRLAHRPFRFPISDIPMKPGSPARSGILSSSLTSSGGAGNNLTRSGTLECMPDNHLTSTRAGGFSSPRAAQEQPKQNLRRGLSLLVVRP
jgi:hypothetical protein